MVYRGVPDSSVDKESTCNAGDPGSIPGSGRSTGEGIGYPLQYSWASLVAQLAKNPPAMRETWVWSLDWEDPLENGKATHSSILAWRIPQTVLSMGSQESDMTEWLSLSPLSFMVYKVTAGCEVAQTWRWENTTHKAFLELPLRSSGWDSTLPVQGAWIWSLLRELAPTCHDWEFKCCN